MQGGEPVHISRRHLTARRLQQLADQVRHAVLRGQVQRCVAFLILVPGAVQDLGHNIVVPIVSRQLCRRRAICILQARQSKLHGASFMAVHAEQDVACQAVRADAQLHAPSYLLKQWVQRHPPEGAPVAHPVAASGSMQSWQPGVAHVQHESSQQNVKQLKKPAAPWLMQHACVAECSMFKPCLQVDINSSIQYGSHQHACCVCMPLLSRPVQRSPAA